MKKVIVILLLLAVVACKKDSPDIIGLSVSEKTLNFGDEYQIEATSESPILYTVENEYHAKVSEIGLVTAMFVGETDITLANIEDTKQLKIIVEPKVNIYAELDVEYGTSRSAIITKYGTPTVENSGAILYDGYSSKAPAIMYMFDSGNKLTGYAILVKTAYSYELGSFLGERYLRVSNDELMFINGLTQETATIVIGAELYDLSYWMVAYIFTENLKSANVNDAKLNKINILKENLKNLFL